MAKGDAREWARRYIGRHPFPFYTFYRLRTSYRDLLVDRRTQIVIVGFPRSGNTLAVVAFQQAQRESVRVAHHLHMPEKVIRAAKWGIPTLLLARKPTDAALSWVIREPGVPIRQSLKHYVSFYEKAAEYHDALVVGFFEEVTRDYGAVLERVNVKFGTGFSSFVHSEDNVKYVFDRIEGVHCAMHGGRLDEKVIAQPSAIKAGLKDALRRDLEAPEVRKLIARAEAVDNSFGPTEGHALQYSGATSSSTFSTISAWCSSQRHDAGDLNGQKLRIVPGSAPKTAESGRGSNRRHRPMLDVRPLHTSIL